MHSPGLPAKEFFLPLSSFNSSSFNSSVFRYDKTSVG